MNKDYIEISGNISEDKDLTDIFFAIVKDLGLDKQKMDKQFVRGERVTMGNFVRFSVMNDLKVLIDSPNDKITVYYKSTEEIKDTKKETSESKADEGELNEDPF